MPAITPAAQQDAAAEARLAAKFRDIELLLQMGEYKQGADAEPMRPLPLPELRRFCSSVR